jgi:chemotaxis protein CheZ
MPARGAKAVAKKRKQPVARKAKPATRVASKSPAKSPAKPSRLERRLVREMESLALVILTAKREIAALRPDEIREKHLPEATDELDAIVGATAEATGSILDAAEHLGAIADRVGGADGAAITDQITRIFEASTFQDITGQRITKVVKTLKVIEARVANLVSAFGTLQSSEAAPAPTGEAALLNGPQLPADARSQADIDAIFDKA